MTSRTDEKSIIKSNGPRLIDANKECLHFLTKQFFDPAVICMEGETSCPRLNETLRFIERNFEREEYLIRASGYEAFDEHRKDHQSLILTIKKIKEKYGCSEYDNSLVVSEINEWLTRHTTEFDHDLIQYWATLQGPKIRREQC